jgi:hypothetical protein
MLLFASKLLVIGSKPCGHKGGVSMKEDIIAVAMLFCLAGTFCAGAILSEKILPKPNVLCISNSQLASEYPALHRQLKNDVGVKMLVTPKKRAPKYNIVQEAIDDAKAPRSSFQNRFGRPQ